MNGRASYMYTQ